jgi:hypothetical protein
MTQAEWLRKAQTLVTAYGAACIENEQRIDSGGPVKGLLEHLAAAPFLPELEPVHGDVLPPIGSDVYIRHGCDDDEHLCTVVGYYAWPSLRDSLRPADPHLHPCTASSCAWSTRAQTRRTLGCWASIRFGPPSRAPTPN